MAIAAGGALGATARYAITRVIVVPHDGFPWATFLINVAGAFVLGAFVEVAARRGDSRIARAFFAVGFLGAFTTFSTLAVETVLLVKDGHAFVGVSYLVAAIVAGLAAAAGGVALGRAAPC
jgi:CrcB protein